LVAPLPIVAVGVVESFLYTSFDVVTVFIFCLIAYVIAFVFTVVLGYPLYRLMERFNVFRWWTSIPSGFFIGAIATISIGHPSNVVSTGVVVNSLAAAASGLLFFIVQRAGNTCT